MLRPLRQRIAAETVSSGELQGSPGTGITLREDEEKGKAGRERPAFGGVGGKER
jgi:hypothetical protein